jgi:hypothetical protein
MLLTYGVRMKGRELKCCKLEGKNAVDLWGKNER